MVRGRTWKNPKVTNGQRDKNLKRRVIEAKADADAIFNNTGAGSVTEKIIDFLKDKRISDHITYRILRGALFGLRYGAKCYPETNEEKFLDWTGMNNLRAAISNARRDRRYGYVSIGSGLFHENPDTKDVEPVLCNMTLESKIVVETWRKSRKQVENTLKEGTELTYKNAYRSTAERQKLARQEYERRQRKRYSQ